MYSIVKLGNGKFQCTVKVQDGAEKFVAETREYAIMQIIAKAKVCNGETITEKDIHEEPHIPHHPLM